MEISERIMNRKNQKRYRTESLRGNTLKKVKYQMRLFVAGDEPNSVIAKKNINKICSKLLNEQFKLDVIDVFQDFTTAIKENILVTPALVIDKPKKTKIFGNLRETDKVLAALESE